MIKIVIIGGGPVGMLLACLLSEIKDFHIVILEKRYIAYHRQQIVVLNKTMLSTNEACVNEFLDGIEGCYVNNPMNTFDFGCYAEGEILASPLYIMETKLFKMTQDRGIKIVKGVRNIDINEVKGIIRYKKGIERFGLGFDILVGADGVKSILKRHFNKYFQEKRVIENDSIYGGIYIFEGTVPVINSKHTKILPIPHARSRVFQHKSGVIYVGLALTGEEAKGNITSDELIKVCRDYLKIGGINAGDLKSAEMFNITACMAQRPVKLDRGRLFLLMGDALMSVHFFTGAGLLSGIKHAIYMKELIGGLLIKHNKNQSKCFIEFEKEFNRVFPEFPSCYQNFINSPKFVIDFTSILHKLNKLTDKDKEIKNIAKHLGIPKEIIDTFSTRELAYIVLNDKLIKN